MKTFVAYYRVSTKSQGDSGLGLQSQKTEVSRYVQSIHGEILDEFTDIESGKNNYRENLWKAVEAASKTDSTLIVKKFDRLSRGGLEVMSRLEKLGVDYIESDSPNDSTLLKELKFSMAKDEVKKVSDRTKAALKVIKEKLENGIEHTSKSGKVVKSLGNPSNLTKKAVENSVKSRKLKANLDKDNVKAAALVTALRDGSGMSFYAITKKLNESGFKTSLGNNYSEVQTKRIYNRFKQP